MLKCWWFYFVYLYLLMMYVFVCYIWCKYGGGNVFKVFELSGELFELYVCVMIVLVLWCWVVDCYGFVEFGVMVYEFDGYEGGFQVFELEGWFESRGVDGIYELVLIGFCNWLMLLICYVIGDFVWVEEKGDWFFLIDIVGWIYDVVLINGVVYLIYYIQDMFDYCVGGIQEFQIDLCMILLMLCIVFELWVNVEEMMNKLCYYWQDVFMIVYVGYDDFVWVGYCVKFWYVVIV